MTIKKVCVFGAGTMGGGIAAHLTNLGFQVTLLDATQASAQAGLDRARTARPPQFYLHEKAAEIRLGNIEENLGWAAEADWVCEAIVERMDAKRALYAELDRILSPDTMITSNTSGLQIELLAEGRSDSFKRRFMGTHFFNPPRYLKLLELIPTPETDPAVMAEMSAFLEDHVARRVVPAKDTPGFIANRYGMWSMFHATRVAESLRLAIEDVDAITGPFMGRPKSGSFRLNDIVGLDIMRDIASNLMQRCPNDPRTFGLELTSSMTSLLGRGWIGDKAGQGYYRREGREMFCLDLNTLAYRMHRDPDLPALEALKKLPLGDRLQKGLLDRSEVGEYLREYLKPALQYANELKEEISHSILDFDRVMKWGFGWEMGPFEMIDAIGATNLGILQTKKFYQEGTQLNFKGSYDKIVDRAKFRTITSFPQIGGGETYTLRDLGDGVTAICMTTKMGVISPKLVAELTELLGHKIDRFVFTSEARSFSAGFDLTFFRERMDAGDLAGIDASLKGLQHLGELLEGKTCAAAIYGHCLGAGLELALSCGTIVSAVETQIGLPESRVGLIPGGRGVTLMRLNNAHNAKRLAEVTGTMAEGTIAGNAEVARQLGYLRPTDLTVFNPDELVNKAKECVVHGMPLDRPVWNATLGPLVGMIDQVMTTMKGRGDFSDYDETIGSKLRQIVARSTGYEDALERERSEFLDLCTRAFTHARVRHMLDTGKPLRN